MKTFDIIPKEQTNCLECYTLSPFRRCHALRCITFDTLATLNRKHILKFKNLFYNITHHHVVSSCYSIVEEHKIHPNNLQLYLLPIKVNEKHVKVTPYIRICIAYSAVCYSYFLVGPSVWFSLGLVQIRILSMKALFKRNARHCYRHYAQYLANKRQLFKRQ